MALQLIDNAGVVLRRAWSVRFMLLAALLSGIEVALNVMTAFEIQLGIPPGVFAGLAGAVTVAAFIARFISQQKPNPSHADPAAPIADAVEASPSKERSKFMGLFTPRRIGIAGGVTGAVTAIAIAAKIISPWEGLATKAYPDRLAHNIPTICFGETSGVKLGDVKTPAECVKMLENSLPQYAAGVRKCIKVDLPAETEGALISTTYNIGVGAFCKSAMVRFINKGDFKSGCDALMLYVNSEGKCRQGLVNRRFDERRHCLGGFAISATPVRKTCPPEL